MARSLQPTLSAFGAAKLERGSLIVLSADRKTARALLFQFNPETVTRTRQGQWEHRKNAQGKEVPLSKAEQALQDSFRGAGFFVKAETIAFKLVFDAAEAILAGEKASKPARAEHPENGILPELALLDLIAFGSDQRVDPSAKPAGQSKLNPIFPSECLLILGPRRFPVVITQMVVAEKRFGPMLVPIRAEIDVTCRALEPLETTNNSVTWQAWQDLQAARQEWRNDVYGTSSDVTVDGMTAGAMIDAVLAATTPERPIPAPPPKVEP